MKSCPAEGDLVHMALLAEMEPVNFEEAVKETLLDEGHERRTWDQLRRTRFTRLSRGKKSITVKWVYKVKLNPKGEVAKYKVRFVTKGFLHKQAWIMMNFLS